MTRARAHPRRDRGDRHGRGHPLVAVVLAALVALAPHTGLASPPAEAEAIAASREELEAGLTAYQRGEYEAAIARFQRAYELHPSPQYLYAWAQAARSLGDCAAAVDLYRRFIDSGATGDSLTAARQNETRCREQLEAEAAARPAASLQPRLREPTPPPQREPEPSAKPPTRDAPRRAPDPAGLGLVVGGTTAALAGATVLVVSGVRRAAQSEAFDYDRFDALDREIDRLDLAGGITLGIGAALVIAGAIRLGLSRRHGTAARRRTARRATRR